VTVTNAGETHAVAVLAVIDAALAAMTVPRHAYDLDTLARLATKPADYVEVTVSRRAGADRRACGATERGGWRVTTRAVGQTETNARLMLERTRGALEYKRLTVGGEVSTPIQFESEEVIGPDENLWTGLMAWTYAI
jgi:hypothetical protein